jgi:hypothetical protein
MCVVSGVYDHFKPRFDPFLKPGWPSPIPDVPDLVETEKLIKQFTEALKAAETVDKLTDQPDCEDPEKAKLKEQVARLEKVVDQLLRQLRTTRDDGR